MDGYWSVEDCAVRRCQEAPADPLVTPWSVRGIDSWTLPRPADAWEVLRMPPRAVGVPRQGAAADVEALLPT